MKKLAKTYVDEGHESSSEVFCCVLQPLHQCIPTGETKAERSMCKTFHIHCSEAKYRTFRKLTSHQGDDLLCATFKSVCNLRRNLWMRKKRHGNLGAR